MGIFNYNEAGKGNPKKRKPNKELARETNKANAYYAHRNLPKFDDKREDPSEEGWIKDHQRVLNYFVENKMVKGKKIKVDGVRGPKTIKLASAVNEVTRAENRRRGEVDKKDSPKVNNLSTKGIQ